VAYLAPGICNGRVHRVIGKDEQVRKRVQTKGIVVLPGNWTGLREGGREGGKMSGRGYRRRACRTPRQLDGPEGGREGGREGGQA